MREEDKVLLLCEIMGIDVHPYVNKYIEELRISPEYLKLCENVASARKVKSFKAQKLIDEFELINFSNVTTLREFYRIKANVHYLLSTSEAQDYINPFFYVDDEYIYNVGHIALDFDKQKFLLDDIIFDERYTTRYKIDYIKDSYLSWRKEVREMIINPLKDVALNLDKIQKLQMFDVEYIVCLTFIAIYNVFFLISPFIAPEFASIYNGTLNNEIGVIFYYLMIGIVFFLDIYFIITINSRFNKTRYYRATREIVENAESILKEIDNKCERFYEYVMSGLLEKKLLNNNISNYSIDDKYLKAISYLNKLGPNKEVETSEDISVHILVKFFIVVLSVLLIIFLITVFAVKGGV